MDQYIKLKCPLGNSQLMNEPKLFNDEKYKDGRDGGCIYHYITLYKHVRHLMIPKPSGALLPLMLYMLQLFSQQFYLYINLSTSN